MKSICLLIIPIFFIANASAQLLERTPVDLNPDVELTFDAPKLINISTVEPLTKGEFHYSIMHLFGTVEDGIKSLYGLDYGANIRFSFEYAPSNRLSIVMGRSGMDKVVDAGLRYHFVKQKTDNSIPLSITLVGNTGITTASYTLLTENDYRFIERISYTSSLLIARKFSEKFSLQFAPMYAYFNRVGPEMNVGSSSQAYFSIATVSRLKITQRTSITAQYIPSFNSDLRSNVALGLDLETGGHVFQLFFSSSQALNDQYLLASPNGDIFARQFRFGFNVNRVFQVGNKNKE